MRNGEIVINGHRYVAPDSCCYGDYVGYGSVGEANLRTIREMCDDERTFVILGSEEIADIEKESPVRIVPGVPEGIPTWYNGAPYAHVMTKEDGTPCPWYRTPGPGTLADLADSPSVIFTEGSYGTNYAYLRADVWKDEIAALEDYPILDESTWSDVEIERQNDAWESWARSDFRRALAGEADAISEAFAEYVENLDDSTLDSLFWDACSESGTEWHDETGGAWIRIEDVVPFAFRAIRARYDDTNPSDEVSDGE